MAVDDVAGGLSQVASGAVDVGILIVILVLVGAVIAGIIFALSYWKKWKQFRVVVWGKDSFGQVYEEYDGAGIFVDRQTQNKRFFLRKNRVGLNPDNVPYVVDRKGRKTVYVVKTGLKNFFFLQPKLNTDGRISFSVGEEDVNWGVNAYERQKKIFGKDTLLQYMPFIALGLVSIVILIIFIYFFRNLSTLQGVAEAFNQAAQALAQAQSGTVVLPS